jgi:hypothetical protein
LLDNIMDKKEGNTLDVTVIMHLNRVTLLGTSLQMLAVVLLPWVQMVLRQEKFSLQIKLRQVVHFTISH